MNTNYAATIVKINNLTKHPNADRLQITSIFGNSVIVGMETKIGDLGMYFPLETQLSVEYAKANDLIRRKDENGKMAGGFLEENRRVRAMKLRGIPSMGLFMPAESLVHFTTGYVEDKWITEGYEFTEYMGTPVCNKYIPKTNQAGGSGKQKEGRKPRESKIIPDQFRFHFDTAQLGRNIHKINPDDVIVITWKMHGTSAIVSNCLVKKDIGFFKNVLKRVLRVPIIDTEYSYIYASRRVIKNEFAESKQHYYGTDLWSEIGKEHFESKLHKGETVYYEIVGYTKEGSPIQGEFDYGCSADKASGWPQHKIYVYRITMTNADGVVTELQWNQVKDRAKEIGVETVPEIFYQAANALAAEEILENKSVEEWQEAVLRNLKEEYVYDQDSQFCHNKVAEEGICVRKEGLNIEVFKLKSFRFLEGETKALDKGEVDTETAES